MQRDGRCGLRQRRDAAATHIQQGAHVVMPVSQGPQHHQHAGHAAVPAGSGSRGRTWMEQANRATESASEVMPRCSADALCVRRMRLQPCASHYAPVVRLPKVWHRDGARARQQRGARVACCRCRRRREQGVAGALRRGGRLQRGVLRLCSRFCRLCGACWTATALRVLCPTAHWCVNGLILENDACNALFCRV
jgi:hypothetical protein